MATTITEGEPRESRTSSAASMRWQRKLATFAECQLNGFANNRAVELDTASGREGSWPRVFRVIIRDPGDSYGYAPRERYIERRGYDDRGGVGFRAPGVSVGIGTDRY